MVVKRILEKKGGKGDKLLDVSNQTWWIAEEKSLAIFITSVYYSFNVSFSVSCLLCG